MELLELRQEFGCQTHHNTMHTELWSPPVAGKKKETGLLPQSFPKISGRDSCFLSPGRKMVFSCQLYTDLIHGMVGGYTPVLM